MQRYSAATSGSGISNNSIGGSSRDAVRADSSFSSPNFPVNQRRPIQLSYYKLKCDKEPLSGRLGPPDFYPQTSICPEETLNKEAVHAGYKEIVEGLDDNRDISVTHVGFLSKHAILRCKESIRRCLRSINESRAQKRKAGQVYGVPLSGTLVVKTGVFPEQRHCGEDFKRKWIEGLSQSHKRLRLLADNVPHGYRRKALFEVLIKHNIPLLRATWFIKVTYLNQVRPASVGASSSGSDKTQITRTELWTKDVIEYLQLLLDELFQNEVHSQLHLRDHSPQTNFGTSQKGSDPLQTISDGEEPSLQFKWWYMVRIVRWHHSEGLLLPYYIVEWLLKQLQEKESFQALELLLPLIFDFIESIALSQSYVRMFVNIALHILQEQQGSGSDSVLDSQRSHIESMLVELLRYLIVTVPDSFISLDFLPLQSCVYPDKRSGPSSMLSNSVDKVQNDSKERLDMYTLKREDAIHDYLSFSQVVSSIKKQTLDLAKAACPSLQGHGEAGLVQSLDTALMAGDVRVAWSALFENVCHQSVFEGWVADVSPCLLSCLKWVGRINPSEIYTLFFLLEWATCDFRDSRDFHPPDVTFTGAKDFSQVYMAASIMKIWMQNFQNSNNHISKDDAVLKKGSIFHEKQSSRAALRRCSSPNGLESKSDIFLSPGPLHDIFVLWLDQHDVCRNEGSRRLQVLIMELIRHCIFYPQAYVRQLIVSGVMDKSLTTVDDTRKKRHTRVLKELPAPYLLCALQETGIGDTSLLKDAVSLYTNERRFLLQGTFSYSSAPFDSKSEAAFSSIQKKQKLNLPTVNDWGSSAFFEHQKKSEATQFSGPGKHVEDKNQVAKLKSAISVLLHFPDSSQMIDLTSSSETVGLEESIPRPSGLFCAKVDVFDGLPGSEECRTLKKQKVGEERSSNIHVVSYLSDDEDTWWLKKGPKSMDLKIEQPNKSTKQSSRARQKIVRKTQSLAQLAAARIEGSQGASSSHVCDHRAGCLHHCNGFEGEHLKDGTKSPYSDILALRKSLRKLRLLERWSITIWLTKTVKYLIEDSEKTARKVCLSSGPFSSATDEKSSPHWKLGEDELSYILYLLDVSPDLYGAVKLLLWLLPKSLASSASAIHGGRNSLMLPRSKGTSTEVGEAFVLSCLQRYENVFVSSDLLPEVLTTATNRAMAATASNGRTPISPSLMYAHYLLKKYGSIASVTQWEKRFKSTCDQRFLHEFETCQARSDTDFGFPVAGVPLGVEDFDDYLRQKLTGRLPRAATTMKEVVHRHVEEAVHNIFGKEKRMLAAGATKGPSIERWDDIYQTVQHIVSGLIDCIRQSSGGLAEWDPAAVAAAVSAIIGSVGPASLSILDAAASSNTPGSCSNMSQFSLGCARRVIDLHRNCLCLLKEALGERHSRVFEIAFATEASAAVSGSFMTGKAPRSQFQLSPETPDSNSNIPTEVFNNPSKTLIGRATKAAAAVSALVIGVVTHGVTSLERMIMVLKVKEGTDFLHFLKSSRFSSNGISRSAGSFKVDNNIEAALHWFRLLAGNFRSVYDGLVAQLLGEPTALSLARMQRKLPLNLILAPAYSIFAIILWRPYFLNSSGSTREDIQLHQMSLSAMSDTVRHQPFRDVCFQDTQAFYSYLASDTSDSEVAAILEAHGVDKKLRKAAFIPLRARLFLNALLECKMPQLTMFQVDETFLHGSRESKLNSENDAKLLNQLVHILDTLQPAKFHWQWVELRLLLNEQVMIEKIEGHNMPLVDAFHYLSQNTNCRTEIDDNFTEIVLTRLLVRPDAAPLYSEVVRLLGKPLEESLLLNAKWFLGGNDVLLGRKSIRQRLKSIADHRGLSTKLQFWKPWGWLKSSKEVDNGEKRKLEASSVEEGEVVEEGIDAKKTTKQIHRGAFSEGLALQQYAIERALAELMLPSLDRSSVDFRNSFAIDLIKQMNTIEQQISMLARVSAKQPATVNGGADGGGKLASSRKSTKGGSPGMGRRSAGAVEAPPSSAFALRASMWLRLQFLIRMLPVIYADREPPGRNMRHMLASVLLRLLGTRVLHEDAVSTYLPINPKVKREPETSKEISVPRNVGLSGESLFHRSLYILHGLLSNCRPSWMKPNSTIKPTLKMPIDGSAFDREILEAMQADLDQMQLPPTIRLRLQATMPILPPHVPASVSCQPPLMSSSALLPLQSVTTTSSPLPGSTALQRLHSTPGRASASPVTGKSKLSAPSQDPEMDIDSWTLLEDGTSCVSTSNINNTGIGDHSNLKASSWLKGAVRIRRTDLTYVGVVDEDT